MTDQGPYQVHYIPTAVVNLAEVIPADRMTERYVRKWYRGSGMSLVRMGEGCEGRHIWFGVSRHTWRQLIECALKYTYTRWTRPSAVWLRAEISMATAWGVITELRRQARLKNQRR